MSKSINGVRDDGEAIARAGKLLTRRHFIQTTTALFSASLFGPLLADSWPTEAQKAIWDAQVRPPGYDPATSNPWGLHSRFLPQRVVAKDGLVPGDIHVDAVARYLYHVEEGGTAMRYGVAIARGNLYEPGTYTIKRKVKWPHWQPTQNMIDRDPELYADIADGMEPGPKNALGSRPCISTLAIETLIFASMGRLIPGRSGAAQAQDVCAWLWRISMIFIQMLRWDRRHTCIPPSRALFPGASVRGHGALSSPQSQDES